MITDKESKGIWIPAEKVRELNEMCAQARAQAERLAYLQRLQLWQISEPGRRLLN